MSLLSLPQVKVPLRILDFEDDDRLLWCIDRAEAIVLDYLKVTAAAFQVGSPAVTVLPLHIETAMILVVEQLFDGASENDPITNAVASLLARSRDPALA